VSTAARAKMLDIGMASSAFDDATFDKLRVYCNKRYLISV
jgi:hypothetical protein